MASFFFSVQTGNMAMIKDRPILIGYMQSLEPNAFSYRVFSYQIPESQYREISALHPDKTKEIARYGIEGLAGNNNQVQLVGGLEANGDKKIQKVIFDELLPYSEDFSPKIPILSTLNAKYIISPEKIADSSLLLSTTTTVTSFEVPLYLYENKDVLPRVRLAKDVIFLKENADDANYRSIFHSGADLLNTTFIECNDCQNAKIKPSPSDQITSLVMEDEKTEFRTKTRSDSWVIIANGNVLGWQAFLDGKPVPIYRADYILQGLYLPAGEHKIELIFKQ